MCGIAGFTVSAPNENHSQIISGMVHCLSHRGPDARNTWNSERVFLGHARLSIIDLSEASNQPMHSADGRYVIVYNGELYNYRELKLELQRVAQGATLLPYFFKTNSDTEVILAAYRKWGPECLQRFNGMFAFALYDTKEKTLFIARDRMGIKPLYYSFSNGNLVFASEIRSVLNSGFTNRKLDRSVISEYFSYQTVHAPNTLIEGVKMLMPGHFMLWRESELQVQKYWNFNDYINKKNDAEYDIVCKNVKELLFKAVERRLVADVPFGAFLSGGIDSSAIVAIMSQMSSKKVESFNVSFDESEFSEAKYARKVAELYKTNHHEIKLSPEDFLQQLPEALNAMDHASGDGPNTYIVSKATKQAGVTMALSGLGGDEIFAGYDVFKRMMDIQKRAYLNIIPQWMRQGVAAGLRAKKKDISGEKIFEVLSKDKISIDRAYPISRKSFSDRQLNNLLRKKDSGTLEKFIRSIPKPDSEHILSYVSAMEVQTYMQNVLLRDTDQMSMAVALEVRVPFLDYQLVEYVLSVKDELKYPATPKKLLTDSLKGLLPAEIIDRPKMGFTLPWKHWLKNELRSFCEQKLNSLSQRDFVIAEGVQSLWRDFLNDNPKVTWSRIWHLVVLEDWIEKNNIS
jgi:asparagine synthase (glutamine-hydrolysing)